MKEGKRKVKKMFLVIALIAIIFIAALFALKYTSNSPSEINSSITQEDMILINELCTIKYPFNAVLEVKDGNSEDKVKYYAAYEGTVSAGIKNFEIKPDDFKIDDENKVIDINVPEVEILDVKVDENIDFIYREAFFKRDAKEQPKALKKCKEDLRKKAEKNEETIIYYAKENATNGIKAFFQPLWPDYKINVLFKEG